MNAHARVTGPNAIVTADGVQLFYRDWPGSHAQARAVLFVGGWSMPSTSWGYQMMALDLRDLALVGHSMGCNEIVRYLSRSGGGRSARVERIALLGPMTPGVTLSPSNPGGVDPTLLEQFRSRQLLRDYPLWIEENIEPFVPGANATTKAWLAAMALDNSLQALHDCHAAVQGADMVDELRAIDVPVLIIAGDRDVSAPLELTARRSAALIPDVRLRVIEGAAHGMFLTHVERVNADLLEFISEPGYIGRDRQERG